MRPWRTAWVGGLAAVLLACTTPTPAALERGRTEPEGRAGATPIRITAAIGSVPTTFNPMIMASTGTTPGGDVLGMMISAGLVLVDQDGIPRPQLAEQPPTTENGLWKVFPDGRMETTWRIRPGAQWHDGAPVTAQDVQFALKLSQDNELAFFRYTPYDAIESIEAPDGRTVVAKWRRPYISAGLAFSFQGNQTSWPQPRHLLEKPYLENKEDFPLLSHWTADFVGSGPYKVREYVAGSHVVLQANDQYVLGRPKIDEIEVKFIQDLGTMVANMLAGTVEMSLGRQLRLEDGNAIVNKLAGAKMYLVPRGPVSVFPQFVNPSPPALANVEFRRALLHAADRQLLVDSFTDGRSVVAHTPFIHPEQVEYRDIEASIGRYEYDVRKAGQLIESLGYTRLRDGFYQDAVGQPLSMEVRDTGNDPVAVPLSDAWRQVGIAAELHIVSRQRVSDREYRATFPGIELVTRGSLLDALRRALHSSEAPLPENTFLGGNRGRYMHPEMDALVDRYEVAIVPLERAQTLQRIVRHVSDQLPVMSLYYEFTATVFAGRIHHVSPRQYGTTQAWNVHEWEVR